jgi:hypothetical protein
MYETPGDRRRFCHHVTLDQLQILDLAKRHASFGKAREKRQSVESQVHASAAFAAPGSHS